MGSIELRIMRVANGFTIVRSPTERHDCLNFGDTKVARTTEELAAIVSDWGDEPNKPEGERNA